MVVNIAFGTRLFNDVIANNSQKLRCRICDSVEYFTVTEISAVPAYNPYLGIKAILKINSSWGFVPNPSKLTLSAIFNPTHFLFFKSNSFVCDT